MLIIPPISPSLCVCRAITRLFAYICLSSCYLSVYVWSTTCALYMCVCMYTRGCTSTRPPPSVSPCPVTHFLNMCPCPATRPSVCASSCPVTQFLSVSVCLYNFSSLSVLPACILPPSLPTYILYNHDFAVYSESHSMPTAHTKTWLPQGLCISYSEGSHCAEVNNYFIMVAPVAQQCKDVAVLIYILGVWFNSNPRLILMRFSSNISRCPTVATSSVKYPEKQLKNRGKSYLGWSSSVKCGNWTVVTDILVGKDKAIPVKERGCT
jgi:hypothetical protein